MYGWHLYTSLGPGHVQSTSILFYRDLHTYGTTHLKVKFFPYFLLRHSFHFHLVPFFLYPTEKEWCTVDKAKATSSGSEISEWKVATENNSFTEQHSSPTAWDTDLNVPPMYYSQPLIIRTCWDHWNLVRIPNIRIFKDSLILHVVVHTCKVSLGYEAMDRYACKTSIDMLEY